LRHQLSVSSPVIPAQAGIQRFQRLTGYRPAPVWRI